MRTEWTPGVYEQVPFDEYLAIDATSNTRLGQLDRSPYHYYTNSGLDERAKHLVLGNLVHCGRLEVLSLAERYAVMPAFHLDESNATADGRQSTSKATAYVKAKVAEFERVNNNKIVVEASWFEEMKAIVAGLVACREANELLSGPGWTELTLVWEDDETGILCKARMDRAIPSQGRFVDLKTTMDLRTFPNAIGRYGYHRQAAHYQDGWAALHGGELLEPWILPVEKTAPYCVQCAPISDDALSEGRSQRNRLMRLLAECRKTNHWPPPESPRAWQLPEWAMEPVELVIDGESLEV